MAYSSLVSLNSALLVVKSSLLWYKSPTDLLLMEEIRHPPVEVGSLSTMVYYGLILHPRWLLGIFSLEITAVYNCFVKFTVQHHL